MAHRSIEETFRTIRPKGAFVPPNSQISASVTGTDGDLGTALSQAGQQIAQLQSAYQQQAALIQANTEALQGNTTSHAGSTLGSAVSGFASSLLGGGLGLLSPLISGIASLFGGKTSTPAPLPVYIPPPSVALSENLQTPGAAAVAPPQTTQTLAGQQQATSISGIASLFGTTTQAPVQLPAYTPPSSAALSTNAQIPALSAQTAAPQITQPQTASQQQGASIYGIANLFTGGTTAPAAPPMYTPPATAVSANSQGPGANGAGAGTTHSSSNNAPAPAQTPAQITVNVQAMDSQSFMDRSTDIANAVREAMLNLHPINAVVAEL